MKSGSHGGCRAAKGHDRLRHVERDEGAFVAGLRLRDRPTGVSLAFARQGAERLVEQFASVSGSDIATTAIRRPSLASTRAT